ncbi:dihydrofolate reductase family protein, partial [Rhodococcus erythropolis]|nr:dihydrofolate reductase family protein [Rhodococcus erythropolis]
MRKLVYYVGASLDGYIAGPDGEFDFFPVSEQITAWICDRYPETVPTHVRPALGIEDAPNRTFDTVVMGRGSYEPGLSLGVTSPFAHLRQFVVSSTLPDAEDPAVTIVRTDPRAVVRSLKEEEGQDIWLCGGGTLAGELLPEIDELIVKRYPVV